MRGATQYTVFVLNQVGGQAYGVWNGQVVGVGAGQGGSSAFWPTPTHEIGLDPPGWSGVSAKGIWGSQQVGYGAPSLQAPNHALLWSGSAGSFVDLGTPNGPSDALAVYNGVQVGGSGNEAYVWHGTAASAVNISPSFSDASAALSIWGNEAVGFVGSAGEHAVVWTSLTAASAVDINPAPIAGSNSGSIAYGVSRGQIAGAAGGFKVGARQNAVIWTSPTASSMVDMSPAGTTASELFATNGTQQVGDVSTGQAGTGLPIDHHAAVWRGTPGSYEPLPSPYGENYSVAYAIDGKGDIAGFVAGQNFGGIGGFLPVLWVPNRVAGDVNFDGSVGFDDLIALAAHYGQFGEWVDGDLNGDGKVDFNDLVILAASYGKSQSGADNYTYTVATPSVPEPSAVVPLCALAALRLRRARGS